VSVCLSLFIPINHLTILSSFAIAGGLYFFCVGFHILARKRLLLGTPTSKIRSAAFGLVEVNGQATGPHTMPAPISGKPCFLYHTTAWQHRGGKKDEWEKVADETLHLPFFVDDSTGQLLIEPLGADLDLHRDLREEYAASLFCSSFFANSLSSSSPDLGEDAVPARVSVFLARHGVVPARRVRIEECSIKPQDMLFIAGALAENPGIQVHPASLMGGTRTNYAGRDDERSDDRNSARDNFIAQPLPQIIRLSGGSAPSTKDMSQQAKIAAALTRAGITKPEAWSAAGVSSQDSAIEGRQSSSPVYVLEEEHPQEAQAKSADFNVAPPVVLMKGANDSTFVISFHSQKQFARALAWKSAAMIWGGSAIMLLGVYTLLLQMRLL
jgi:hypothetical protein